MKELSHNIVSLLAENDCVILPGIGGFIASYKCASYVASNEEFVSPSRKVGFNRSLTMNDGLIVQAYMQSHGVNYPEASKLLDRDLAVLQQKLNDNGSVKIDGLGMLVRHANGAYSFEMSAAQTITPELYGLPNVNIPLAKPQAVVQDVDVPETTAQKIEDTEVEETEESATYNISVKRSLVHKVAAVAAAVLVSFILSTPATDTSHSTPAQAVIGSLDFALDIPAAKTTEKVVAPVKNEPIASETTADKHEEVKPQAATLPYTVVLASAVSEKNANDFIKSLKNKGYDEVEIYTTPGMRRVIYSHFATQQQAQEALNRLSNTENFADGAWVMKIRIR